MTSKLFRHIYLPRNTIQQKYNDVLQKSNKSLIIAEGPAGTGKTAFACQSALEQLHNKRIKKIIITRPIVAADEGIGFLKGGLNQKMDPWIMPMMDIFSEFYSVEKIRHLFETRTIEVAPFSFMRGRTFKSAFIIADEVQNTTPIQLKLLLTRIGENSKMILTGDLSQSDLERKNGLEDLISRLQYYYLPSEMYSHGIALIRFDTSHIERHPLLSKLEYIYNQDPSHSSQYIYS